MENLIPVYSPCPNLELPVGYRYLPSDMMLITHFLVNKAIYDPFLASTFPVITPSFYSEAPDMSVDLSGCVWGNWLFFVNVEDMIAHSGNVRRVGNQVGYWKSTSEKVVSDNNGRILAIKKRFVYYNGSFPSGEKTKWRMEEFRFLTHFYDTHKSQEKWRLGKLMNNSVSTQAYEQLMADTFGS